MNPAVLPERQSSVVLRPSKRKMILLMLVCLTFVAGGIYLVQEVLPGGWFAVLFGGVGLVVFVIQIIPGASYLQLKRDGFEFCSFFRKSGLIRWGQVSEFGVWLVPLSRTEIVVFDYEGLSKRVFRDVNRRLMGASDGLPDSYGLKPQELADVMNAWRAHALQDRPGE